MTSANTVAACFDFWKNLPSPNVTTRDIYYKRQLSTYTFNVHELGSNTGRLFTYGSNEVCSMLMAYFNTLSLSPDVNRLLLFCDSCPGQNKNWTVFRFLHYMVHQQ
ncbi:voltage-dependent calcium channel unc-36 [Elysia marginata]|uniref:Voltage-dependent calcium channel unc-36 n=1 Tax=Elysia marginata TaxID=1093978 RepID=A0AAV4JGE2_9GAST|nr:voltage-dependent calcium channel unc-36 [Elysia marginata]